MIKLKNSICKQWLDILNDISDDKIMPDAEWWLKPANDV